MRANHHGAGRASVGDLSRAGAGPVGAADPAAERPETSVPRSEAGGHAAASLGASVRSGPGPVREGGGTGSRWETAFGYSRDFLRNRFVYLVVSPRAHGLSVGINMNPDKQCNFDCVYCEVNRQVRAREEQLEVPVMVHELHQTLALIRAGRLHDVPGLRSLPEELLALRHVALSGDGEPTLCPNFDEAVQGVLHVRALGELPFFKVVLVSNATGLDRPEVQAGLHALSPPDEVWLKLDGGSREYIERINRPKVALEKVLDNILLVGRQRPIVIQSLFPKLGEAEPAEEEIEAFVVRLRDLRDAGARISLVQVYSAMRPTMLPECGHLPLRTLSRIAHAVRAGTGLRAEVF